MAAKKQVATRGAGSNPAAAEAAKPEGGDWSHIDTGLSSRIGKRIFYQHERFGKCIAFLVAPNNGERDAQGRLADTVFALHPDGGSGAVKAPWDGARTPGTWDIAREGD